MTDDFGLPPEVIRELVGAAVRAPSSHNTQPWLFRPTADGVDLLADRTRALAVNDPHDRELTISCGAALHNLEAASQHLGMVASTVLLPEPDDPDLLATTSLVPGSGRPIEAEAWFDCVTHRRTTRGPLASPEDPRVLDDLIPTSPRGVTFTAIEATDRDEIAELVAQGDHAQFADARWRRELAAWMHPRRRGDGLVVPELVGLVTKAVVTAFDLGKSTADTDVDLVHAAPLLILVTSERDDAEAWLQTGRALEDFLLAAASRGLAAGYLNQPCQVPELRMELQHVAPVAGFPQLLIRVGTSGDHARATPRRPIDDVVLEAGNV